MAAKIMNISLKQTSIKVKHWKSLMDSQLLFLQTFITVVSRNNNLNYLPPTPPDSSEKERIKKMFGIIF